MKGAELEAEMMWLTCRLVTGWTIRNSNSGRDNILRTHPEGREAHPCLCTMGTRTLSSGIKRPVELRFLLPSMPAYHVKGQLYLHFIYICSVTFQSA